MTLSGRILPVAGIREKLLAARRAGAGKVILPAANEDAVTGLGPALTQALEIVFVSHASEVIDHVLVEKSYLLR